MTELQRKAVELHQSGFNCAQAVCAACAQLTGLDGTTSLAATGGFGGGFRYGEICGALSGAVMAVGLACPYTDASDTVAKEKIAELAKACCEQFEREFGCIPCRGLKADPDCDCNIFIAYAAGMAEEMIKREREK